MPPAYVPFLMFGLPGGTEMILILIVGLLLFGGRLPEVARNIGKGIQEFKKGLGDLDRDVTQPLREVMSIDPSRDPVPYEPPRLASQATVARGEASADDTDSADETASDGETASADEMASTDETASAEDSTAAAVATDLRDRAEDESRLAESSDPTAD